MAVRVGRYGTKFFLGLGALIWLGAAQPAQAVESISTEEFLTRYFGVNLHLDNCCNGRYGDLPKVISEIKYIGARRLRAYPTTQPGLLQKWQAVYNATGAKFNAAIPMASPTHQRIALNIMDNWLRQAPGMIQVIEGGNEEDTSYPRNLGATLEDTAALQHQVYAVGKANKVKVAQLSVGAGWVAPHYEGNYKKFGRPPADLGNAHVYMNLMQPPTISLKRIGELAAWSVPGKPVEVTEFGVYRHPQQDEATTSGYMHIAPFASYLQGHAGLMVYALHDDVSNAMGFYRVDGSPRPFAKYWNATSRLLADPKGKNLPRKNVSVSFSGIKSAGKGSYGVKNVVMHKSDGSIWVAAYDEAAKGSPPGAVTITFGKIYPRLLFYDGRTGIRLATLRNTRSVKLSLPSNHVLFIAAMPK